MKASRGVSARFALLAFLFLDALAPAQVLAPSGFPSDQDPVRASLELSSRSVAPGGSIEAVLVLEHAPGWHSYGPGQQEAGLPTKVEWTLPPGISADAFRWPETEGIVESGVAFLGYSGRVEARTELRASKELKPGTRLKVEAKISWLACNEACVPGLALIGFDIEAAGGRGGWAWRFFLALAGAFAGGILLNLMPCVLPVLALKFDAFIRQGSASRLGSLARGGAYALGVLLSFWTLALAVLALKAGGASLGWGFQFQSPAFIAALAVFFIVLALNMLGVFEIGAAAAGFAGAGTPAKGMLRSFLSGALAVLAASPCAAPFMGAAVGYALGSGPLEALAVFGALGLGMALPVLALSAFPGLTARLPKPGRWMETLQRFLGFVLLGSVIWLLSILASLSGAALLLRVLAALLAVSLAAWIWGRWGRPASPPASRRIAGAVAALVFCASLAFALLSARPLPASANLGSAHSGTSAAQGGNGGEASPPRAAPVPLSEKEGGIEWLAFSQGAVDRERSEGKPVFIDFRADWCLSCLLNEEGVLKSDEIEDAFARLGVAAFKADWTKADPSIEKALASFGRRSVPLYVLYLPGKAEPLLLPEILSRRLLLDALEGEAP